MTRDEIKNRLLVIFEEQFEISQPGMDEDLRDTYEFDSIDAIELLQEIEVMIDRTLTQEEKKSAMTIRTLAQVIDYVEAMEKKATDGTV